MEPPLEESQGALRGLNERLRSFLEHVQRLEATNRDLEQRILDWGRRNVPPPHDWSAKEAIMEDLKTEVRGVLLSQPSLGAGFTVRQFLAFYLTFDVTKKLKNPLSMEWRCSNFSDTLCIAEDSYYLTLCWLSAMEKTLTYLDHVSGHIT